MAENDIELSVGIKLDEAQFLNSYNSFISKTASDAQKQVQSALDDTKGAAAKQWGPLPYVSMHNTTSGASAATKAFLPSFASDLAASGYSPDSLGYQSALINAAYKSSMADPMQRYHRMLAMGLTQQADLTHPDTPLGKAIETDYALMSQPWSRDFIRKGQQEVLNADELEKMNLKTLRAKGSAMGIKGLSDKKKADVISALVSKSQEPALSFDFEGMRKYAVDTGLGRWIDEDKGNTADNFELISDELDNIDEKSEKSNKTFLNWNDTLKGVLGTLTAIGSIAGIAKVFETAYTGAEKGTTQAATTLDRKRAFIGMGALDVLATQVASQSIGLGKNTIYDEILNLSNSREQYKLLGEGLNALFPSLSGVFDNLMSSDNPYDTYKGILTEVYGQLQGADDDTRAQALMLLEQQGLGSAASIIGSFLSNPTLAAQMGNNPTNLFTLKANPYYSVYNRAEAMLPDLTQLNASIKASYEQMATDWQEAFGEPFKTWWDSVLKNKVVPWFEAILAYVNPEATKERKSEKDFNKEWKETLKAQQKANSVSAREKISGYWGLALNDAAYLNGVVSWSSYSPDRSMFTTAGWENAGIKNLGDGKTKGRDFIAALEKMASTGVYANPDDPAAYKMQGRAMYAMSWLESTGLKNDLKDLSNTDVDKYTMRVIREYLAEGNNDILDTYLVETYKRTEGWQKIIEFIDEYRTYLKEHPEARNKIQVDMFGVMSQGMGKAIGEEIDKAVNRSN